MPYVPGVVDSSGDGPAGQAPGASTAMGAAGGSPLPEAYQMMALAMMNKMGRFQKTANLPGSRAASPAAVKAQMQTRKAAGK